MIQGYEVISKDEKNQSSLVSIQEDTEKKTTIVCKKNDPLQESILTKNEIEILKEQKQQIVNNKALLSKNKPFNKMLLWTFGFMDLIIISVFIYTVSAIAAVGALPVLLFSTGAIGFGAVAASTLFIDLMKQYRKNKATIRNLNTILSNIDMKLTRIKDLDHSPKSKQKYFKKEKGNIHFTTINVEKMKEDNAQYIQNVWYGLNHDNCAKIIKKNHRKSKTTKQLEKLFEPVNVDTMTTKKFVKQIQNSSRKSL